MLALTYFPEFNVTAADRGGVYIDLFPGQIIWDDETEEYLQLDVNMFGKRESATPFGLLNTWNYAAGAREAGWDLTAALTEYLQESDD